MSRCSSRYKYNYKNPCSMHSKIKLRFSLFACHPLNVLQEVEMPDE